MKEHSKDAARWVSSNDLSEDAAAEGANELPVLTNEHFKEASAERANERPDVTNEHSIDAINIPVFILCRRGNDSQVAVSILKALKLSSGSEAKVGHVRDIAGGLHAWANHIDPC